MGELSEVLGLARPVAVGEREILLKPLTLAQLPMSARLLQGVEIDGDWLGLLARHGDKLIDWLALASGQERRWIEGLPLDEGVELLAAVVELNADFFDRRVWPAAQRTLARIETRLTGKTSSSG